MAVEVEDHPSTTLASKARSPRGNTAVGTWPSLITAFGPPKETQRHNLPGSPAIRAVRHQAQRRVALGPVRQTGPSAAVAVVQGRRCVCERSGSGRSARRCRRPTADIRRAGGGKADKKKLKALPAKRARRKNWAKKALALPKAKEAAPPSGPFEPQLAKLGGLPQGDQWVHEIKWDGYRILATVADGAVRLWSRNALEWTDKIPRYATPWRSWAYLCCLGWRADRRIGHQGGLQPAPGDIVRERQGALAYALFDLLHLDGVDVAAAPLLERKALLQELLEAKPAIWPSALTSKATATRPTA